LTHPNISSVYPVQTNIVIAETIDPQGAAAFVEEMKQKEVLCFPFGPNKVRFVSHLGINRKDIDAHSVIL
jgi:threonine aldolase